MKCECLLAFKPDCFLFLTVEKFTLRTQRNFAKGAKTFNDGTIGTVGTIDSGFKVGFLKKAHFD